MPANVSETVNKSKVMVMEGFILFGIVYSDVFDVGKTKQSRLLIRPEIEFREQCREV